MISRKNLFWVMILIWASGVIQIWYMNRVLGFANDVTSFITQAHKRFKISLFPATKQALFWNGCESLKDQTIPCPAPGDNCVFKVRSNASNNNMDHIHSKAIIFNEKVLNSTDRPRERFEDQLFIFWSLESAAAASACQPYNDNFFNWTLSYRLDSTIVWSPFVVRDRDTNTVVAPNRSVVWKENLDPLKPVLKNLLTQKSTSLVWILKDCTPHSKRDSYMLELQKQISNLGLIFDIYGPCTNTTNFTDYDCDEMIKWNYYFYIAFEDTFAEDFISDTVLQAYKNYAVPIVYGGANYSWYLPPGSYLNAKEMHPYSLAYAVRQAVDNADLYESFFKWTNAYSIETYSIDQHPLCRLCAAINGNVEKQPAIEHFRQWWNTPEGMQSCN